MFAGLPLVLISFGGVRASSELGLDDDGLLLGDDQVVYGDPVGARLDEDGVLLGEPQLLPDARPFAEVPGLGVLPLPDGDGALPDLREPDRGGQRELPVLALEAEDLLSSLLGAFLVFFVGWFDSGLE